MFVLDKSATYKWPVKIETPKDTGSFNKESFVAEFSRLPQSRLKELFGETNPEKAATDHAVCKEILKGWSDVKDSEGHEVEFSEGSLQRLLEIPGTPHAIVSAYMESIAGHKVKN